MSVLFPVDAFYTFLSRAQENFSRIGAGTFSASWSLTQVFLQTPRLILTDLVAPWRSAEGLVLSAARGHHLADACGVSAIENLRRLRYLKALLQL